MKVKPLLKSIPAQGKTFLKQYLTALGIDDPETYLKADFSNIEDPWSYPNMKEAVEACLEAIQGNKKFGIIVDCDVDGQLSAAIVADYFHKNHPKIYIEYFFHVGKAHGIVQNNDEDLVEQVLDKQIEFLIVPDAGSDNADTCQKLKDKGIQILVLDHHKLTIPNPYAIIVNQHLDSKLNSAISGTGVTHKFIQALAQKEKIDLKNKYYDMVAISLISDVCDLRTLENRSYIQYGLTHITSPMIAELCNQFNRKGNNPVGISWGVAPPINSLCRSDDIEAKQSFFKSLINVQSTEAGCSIVRKAHNQQIKAVKVAFEEVLSTVEEHINIIVCYTKEEYKNYTGLIANKIMDQYKKPVIVLRELNALNWTGSLRTPVALASKINQSKYARCYGHEKACGITIAKSKLKKFITWIEKLKLDFDEAETVAAIIEPKKITLNLCKTCENNDMLWSASDTSKMPAPIFYSSFKSSPNNVQVFYKKYITVRITYNDVTYIKFKVTQEEADLLVNEPCKVEAIVSLCVNEWDRKQYPQARIEKWEVTPYKDTWEDYF